MKASRDAVRGRQYLARRPECARHHSPRRAVCDHTGGAPRRAPVRGFRRVLEGGTAGTGRCPHAARAVRCRSRSVPAATQYRPHSQARTASRQWMRYSSPRGQHHRGRCSRTRLLHAVASPAQCAPALRRPHDRLVPRAASPATRKPGSAAARSSGAHAIARLPSQVVACGNYGQACTRSRSAGGDDRPNPTRGCTAVPLIRVKWARAPWSTGDRTAACRARIKFKS